MRGFPRAAFLLLALAALLRCVWLWDAAAHSPYHGLLLLDAAVYDDWARQGAAGQLFRQDVFPLPPLYPTLLAALYRVAGSSQVVVALAQSCLGIASLALMYGVGRRLFGPRPALIALALGVLYGPFAFHEAKLLSATLGLALGMATLALLLAVFPAPPARRARPAARAALAGALLGLTTLVRPEVLLFAPLAAAWLWHRPGRAVAARRSLVAPAAFAAGLALLLAPVAARNARIAGGWSLATLISSQGGITFYQGNNERAAGLYVSLAREGFSGDILAQASEERRLAEERVGRPLSRAEVSGYWFGRGLAWIRSDPAGFALLLGRKLVRAFGSCEYSTEYLFALERGFARSLWLMPVPFALIGGCGLVGLGLLARERRLSGDVALLLGWALANLTAVLAFYVSTRYRLAATPVWMLLAGYALDRGVTALAPALGPAGEGGLRARLARLPGRTGVVLLVGAALVAALHPPLDQRHRAQEADGHHNIAVLRQRAGDAAEAVAAYDRALQIAPDHWRAWYGLGTALEETGRRDAAAHAYRMALRRNPSLAAARQRLRALGESSPPS